MKKNLILYLALMMLAFTSCDSYFDINLKDQPTMEDLMSRPSSVRRYLAHLYSYLPMDENVRDNEGGVVLRADECLNGSSQYETYWYKVRRGDYSPATSTERNSGNIWSRYYIAINQCTTFMQNLYLDKEDTPALMASMMAEARFLRAYYYYVLFRHYGPVIIWGDAQADQNVLASSLDRNTVDENIDFIVSELDKAIPDLPISMSDISQSLASNMGRATRGAAMALKARVLLMAASPLYNGQNGTGIYNSFKNSRGELLFPTQYDAVKWDSVATAAKRIIDLDVYQLTEVSSANTKMTEFQRHMSSYQNVWFENWSTNPETIWGWWFRTLDDGYLGSVGHNIGFSAPRTICLEGYSLITPSLKLVDAYPMAETGRYPVLGYRKTSGMYDYSRPLIDPESGYERDGFETYVQPMDYVLYDQDGNYPSWAKPVNAHKSCIGRDVRFYATVVPNGFWWPSAETLLGPPQLFTCYNSDAATVKWMSEGQVNRVGYAWRRLYKAGNPLKTGADYNTIRYVYPAFRLAEVYFTYAEACNEKSARDADEAIFFIDKVRARSGLPGLRTSYPEIAFENGDATTTIGEVTRTNKEWLRWIISQEKMVEMSMEGQRHYDAVRRMTALDEYPCENWTLHVRANNYEDSYQRVSDDYMGGHPTFRTRDYLFPISSTQLSEMTSFTQNPGW